ncbi:cytoplasmic polyadenylation element-binding protein 1 [Euwallacea similis]|uniref:cytoplasmic polyadenylation element-binding protein 1 n=1 Tax=Euwallacea similis TaxID=1736056 RepID=UPI00344D8117
MDSNQQQVLKKNSEQNQLTLDMLQNFSINSLLNQEDALWDEHGLNTPRGLLNLHTSNQLSISTPPFGPATMQGNFDEARLPSGYPTSYTSPKNLQRNISLGSAGSSPASPPYLAGNFRSVSLSESCGSNQFEHQPKHPILGRNFSRSDSTDGFSQTNMEIVDLLNSISLSENLTRNLLESTHSVCDVDLSNLQNLQAIQTLKYLQQPLLHSLFPNHQWSERWRGSQSVLSPLPEHNSLDRAARFHRSAASVYDAVCTTWSGVLSSRSEKPSGYSSKVFLGGIPWDISEECLMRIFRQFNPIKVEWPGKDRQASQPKGYAYLVLESEKSVKALLQACANNYANNGNYYYKIESKKMRSKDIQVIPWYLSDSNYTKMAPQKLDPSMTVFVGALHGMLNAEGLAKIMDDLFGGVVYAGIDTDKNKYPIGSGRVTFNNPRSYMKAVSASFIEIKAAKFTKKVQVDPYLEDSLCSLCGLQQGPYFCRDLICFRYYCQSCWSLQHCAEFCHHNPMSRNSKQMRRQNATGDVSNSLKPGNFGLN